MASDCDVINKSLPLRINFLWNFVGRVVYAVCQWGILVAIAKMGSPDMVGQFGLGLALTAPVFAFSNMDVRSIVATDVTEQHNFNQYYTVRRGTNLLSLVFICILMIILGYNLEIMTVIMAIAVAKAFEGSSDIVFGLMQQHERLDYIAKSSILKGFLSVVGVAIIMYITHSLMLATISIAFVWGILFYLYDIPNAYRLMANSEKLKIIWHLPVLKKIIILALPLGIAAALNSLNTNIPRYFIEQYQGSSALGYFVALSYIVLIGDNVANTLGQAAIARLAKDYKDSLSKFLRLLIKLMCVGLLMGIIGIFVSVCFGKELLTFLYTADYAQHTEILIVLMVAGLVIYTLSFISFAMIAVRYIKVQAFISLIVVAGCFIAGLLLIPRYGLAGAAWTVFITFTLKLILGSVLMFFYLRTELRLRKLTLDEK